MTQIERKKSDGPDPASSRLCNLCHQWLHRLSAGGSDNAFEDHAFF
jgi:hypothetical protein